MMNVITSMKSSDDGSDKTFSVLVPKPSILPLGVQGLVSLSLIRMQ